MTDLPQEATKLAIEHSDAWLGNFAIEVRPYFFCSLIFWFLRVLSKPNDTLRMHIYDLCFSVPVGTLAGAIAMEYQHMIFLSMGCASMASLVARDWVKVFLDTGWGQKLDSALDSVLDAVKSRIGKGE